MGLIWIIYRAAKGCYDPGNGDDACFFFKGERAMTPSYCICLISRGILLQKHHDCAPTVPPATHLALPRHSEVMRFECHSK